MWRKWSWPEFEASGWGEASQKAKGEKKTKSATTGRAATIVGRTKVRIPHLLGIKIMFKTFFKFTKIFLFFAI